ncbi:MAG: glycosyltransferase family 2 protein [Rhodanobacteraceae bacterium]|nr:glycosyltransferase family 2 protein [Rhodanobacteraceae bacterium]
MATRRWRQALRLLPLWLTLHAADLLAACLPPSPVRSRRMARWKPGLAILIPESGTPGILADTLAALRVAANAVSEPVRIHVLVNGAPRRDYHELMQTHSDVNWRFVGRALGFHGAVEAGMRELDEDWVYLLNSDMRLQPDALAQVLPLRDDGIFAIASRIKFQDRQRRAEETGLTGWSIHEQMPRPYDCEPDPLDGVVEHLYAGGGASLFRTTALRRALRNSRCYQPFYLEDVDWGVSAWRQGLRVVFCPSSLATHLHRATISRFAPDEVERVVRRNQCWLESRQALAGATPNAIVAHVCRQPASSQREMAALRPLPSLFASRVRAARTPHLPALAEGYVTIPAHLPGARRGQRPRLLWITPFALLPTIHRDAHRRMALMTSISAHFEVILLSDEGEHYPADSWRELSCCHAIRLIGGRPKEDPSIADPVLARFASHAHTGLRVAVAGALAHFRPDIVHVEHLAAAELVELRGEQPWTIAVQLAAMAASGNDAADHHQRALLSRYDSVIVDSGDDHDLLGSLRTQTIANAGSADR